MSDNDYNNNPYEPKKPWEKSGEDSVPEPEAEHAEGEVQPDAENSPEEQQDIYSSDTKEAGTEEKPGDDSADAQQNQGVNPGTNPGDPSGPNGSPYNGYGAPYGQNQNPYGQYQNQNQYGSYGSQYGGYQQNQYNPYNGNPYQPQGQPYWSYQQQYGGQYQQNPQQPVPHRGKNTGLKVFLWILGVLVVGSVLGFSIFGVYTSIQQKNGALPPASQAPQYGGAGASSGSSAPESSSAKGQVQAAPGNGTNPNASGIVINQQPGGTQLTAKEVYKRVVQSVVGVETTISNSSTGETGTGQGTGIVATSNGYILTNAHVVEYSRANKVKVILYNKREYAATVVGFDKTSDIAVLKINANNLTPATFGNADQLEVGDQVIAIGNPGGLNYASSLTGGYVSALNRTIESHSDNGMTYIQTDAAINPGNSGGPLVNMYGQVVGINSNKIVATGFEGMGFSIPISRAKSIIDDLVARGYVTGRSRLGITAAPISDIQSQLSGLPTGVMIREISAESDLRKSNVVVGDIITQADGSKIASLDDLYAVLNRHKAGDVITLTVYSQGSGDNGVTRQVRTKLLEDKGETQAK